MFVIADSIIMIIGNLSNPGGTLYLPRFTGSATHTIGNHSGHLGPKIAFYDGTDQITLEEVRKSLSRPEQGIPRRPRY